MGTDQLVLQSVKKIEQQGVIPDYYRYSCSCFSQKQNIKRKSVEITRQTTTALSFGGLHFYG